MVKRPNGTETVAKKAVTATKNTMSSSSQTSKGTSKQNVSEGDGAEGHHGPELHQQQALHGQQRLRAEALRQCGLAVQGKRSFG